MTEPREIRVFVASPGDLPIERERVERVVARLNSQFVHVARFVVVRWEKAFYVARADFQSQIPDPADCDIVLVMFGNRLGSELPDEFDKRLPDGSAYPSGTAYELLSSLAVADVEGHPDVFVFRRTSEVKFGLSERDGFEAAKLEQARLDAFFEEWFRTPTGGFRRAFHLFEDADEFETQADTLLRQWAEKALKLVSTWKVDLEGSPFRGLEPFDARHARVYFGRDRKVQRAVDELLRTRQRPQGRPFLLVVGHSGAGKSSLVRAGVIPRLTAPGVVSTTDLWRVAVMRPGGEAGAFAALAEALFVNGEPESDKGGFGAALPELGEGPIGTPVALRASLESAAPSAFNAIVAALDAIGEAERVKGGFSRTLRTDLLLLVDQIEETFIQRMTDDERRTFARCLTMLADTGRVWIIATLRADLYAQTLDQTSPFLALKDTGGSYDLASPGESELREILEKSASAAGLVYDQDPTTGESLDEVLLRDATGADTLPLLQFSLKMLFENRDIVETPDGRVSRLTFAAYRALGGLDGAIDQVAESAINDPASGLSRHEIDSALPQLLRRLAEPIRVDHAATAAPVALTARSVPMVEATADAASRKIVDVLAGARLLVLASVASGEATVRLAHERVLTSWKLAREIILANRDFFRVKADIETQHVRWVTGGQRREFLLVGLPLYEAEAIVRNFGGELGRDLMSYVKISGRRQRLRQRLTAGAASVFFVVAVVAIGFALIAVGAEQKAERNYTAAKDAADDLVSSIGKELRTQKGISSQTLDIVFGITDSLIVRIQKTASEKQGVIMQLLQRGFTFAEGRVTGTQAGPSDAAALERSRSNMLYEFAETYHQSANDLKEAYDKAQQSLTIRERLRTEGDDSPDARVAIAQAQIELADLDRAMAAQVANSKGKTSTPDLADARRLLAAATATLQTEVAKAGANVDWVRLYGKALTRLGDLDLRDGSFATAQSEYDRVQVINQRLFRARPGDTESVRELAWGYRKISEVRIKKNEVSAAIEALTNEVCLRRRLAGLNPENTLWQRDLGWSLVKAGDARLKSQPPDFTDAQDAYFEAMVSRFDLIEADPSEKVLFQWFVTSLQDIASLYRAQGQVDNTDLFAGAADDIRATIPKAFRTEESLPKDAQERKKVLDQEADLRHAGVMAMIDPKRREAVEIAKQDFVVNRLPALRRDAGQCWSKLIGSLETASNSSAIATSRPKAGGTP